MNEPTLLNNVMKHVDIVQMELNDYLILAVAHKSQHLLKTSQAEQNCIH